METRPGEPVDPSPLAMTREAFVRAGVEGGLRPGQATNAYTAFWREGVDPRGTPSPLVPEPTRVQRSDSDHGEVRKFLLPIPGASPGGPARRAGSPSLPPSSLSQPSENPEDPARRAGPPTPRTPRTLPDTLETESVIIPMRRGDEVSYTLCLSSQVGCAMGCDFCETAQMGLIRNLTTAEITQQWWAAKHHLGVACRNIVFMGMGEPLDNAAAVLGAIEVLTDHHGAALGMKRISLSTVGRLDGLAMLRDKVAQHGWKRLNLAVSINAPNDEIRSKIMPINRAMPLGKLIPMLETWPIRGGGTGGAICCEYVLIPGVNDAMEHADELAELLRNVRCCVNVIPYNPRRDSPWPAPSEESVLRFLQRLEAHGQFCKRRVTKGRESMAACGQLGNENIRKRRLVGVTIS